MKMRLIQPAAAIPRYRQLRLPVVAAEFGKYIDVSINDENIEKLDYSPVDLVGLTCQTYNANRAFYIADQFRQRNVKTILGGVFATAMPRAALEHFDSVVIGEVEGLGSEIIEDLGKRKLKKIYTNERPPDLSKTSLPRLDLLENNRYYRFNFPLETSRGCPHRCTFCFSSYQYPVYRKRSLADIERDLDRWDHGMVELIDLHFGADKKFLFEICDLFKQKGVLSWFGESTIRSLGDRETVRKLAESNCRMVFVGLESISSDTLKGVNKGFNDVKEYRRIIEQCNDHGIFIHAGFIWGLDGQDESVFEETLKFCLETKLYLASSNMLTYFPGTAPYEAMLKDKRILTQDYRDYDSAHLTVKPNMLSPAKLLDGITQFTKKFYSCRSIARRAFQPANNNIMILSDYLGFNLLYRAYYRLWIQKVKKGIHEILAGEKRGKETVRKNPEPLDEKNSLPHLYRNIPLAYSFFEWNWRYWDFWFHRFIRTVPSIRLPFRLTAIVLFIAASTGMLPGPLQEYFYPRHHALPVLLLLNYAFLWLATGMLIYSIPGRLRRKPAALGSAVMLLIPLLAFPLHQSGDALLMTTLALVNTIVVLKNISFLNSSERMQSSLYRYFIFQLLSPSLNYETSFSLDFRNTGFEKSFCLIALGMVQAATAFLLITAHVYLAAILGRYWDYTTTGFWILIIVKGLILYYAFAGIMNAIAGFWKLWGYYVLPPFGNPLLAPSPPEFWRRFNSEYHRWSVAHIFKPMVKRFAIGGRFLGTVSPFVLSGMLTLYVFAVAAVQSGLLFSADIPVLFSHDWILLPAGFFLLNGLVVYAQKVIFPEAPQDGIKGSNFFISLIKIFMTLVCISATSSLFFLISDRILMFLY